MNWSDNQISQLRELCFAEKSNAEIAKTLNINTNDVYAKRSQLGITIPKVRALKGHPPITVNPEFETAVQEMEAEIAKSCKTCHYWVCCLTGTENEVKGCKHHVTADARKRDLAYMAKAEFLSRVAGTLPNSAIFEIKAVLDTYIPDSWKLK